MEYRRLGNSGLKISRIGFGTEPLGGMDWGSSDLPENRRAVRTALDLGINVFDTARVYGLGRSEAELGNALGPHRHGVVIVTKGGLRWEHRLNFGRAAVYRDATRRNLIADVEQSLATLGLDSIPLYLLHWPDPNTPLEETMQALADCQKAGKVQHIGLSNCSLDMIRAAHRLLPLTAVQLPYSLIERTHENGIFPLCRSLGISVFAYGVLAQGLLTGKYSMNTAFGENDRRHRLRHFAVPERARHLAAVERLRRFAEGQGATTSQAALRWVLDNDHVTCAIAGARTRWQVMDNATAASLSFTKGVRHHVEAEIPLPPGYVMAEPQHQIVNP